MIILKVTPQNQRAAVQAAVSVLKRGGVIAYPTETTYGLGCDPRNAKAIARIYRFKGREKKKPFLLVAASISQVKLVAKIERLRKDSPIIRIMATYWPGPLTLVLPARTGLDKSVVPQKEVAVRVSSSRLVRRIAEAFGFPIVSTSANKTGEPDARSGQAVRKMFSGTGPRPDLVLDIGSLPRRKPSTVARVGDDGSVEILRRGAIRLLDSSALEE